MWHSRWCGKLLKKHHNHAFCKPFLTALLLLAVKVVHISLLPDDTSPASSPMHFGRFKRHVYVQRKLTATSSARTECDMTTLASRSSLYKAMPLEPTWLRFGCCLVVWLFSCLVVCWLFVSFRFLSFRFVSFRFVLFCFVLFCFVLFCFVLFCFVLFCFVLFCFVLFCCLPVPDSCSSSRVECCMLNVDCFLLLVVARCLLFVSCHCGCAKCSSEVQ